MSSIDREKVLRTSSDVARVTEVDDISYSIKDLPEGSADEPDEVLTEFDIDPPQSRRLLVPVCSYGLEVAEAILIMEEPFNAYSVSNCVEEVQKGNAKRILEEMERVGMVEEVQAHFLGDKHTAAYTTNAYTPEDAEEMVEEYRAELEFRF